MRSKVIIIGASTTGKTTLIKYLRENTDFALEEIDEVLTRMNNGTYPKDGDYRHKVLQPKIVTELLGQQGDIVFFTNTNVFSIENLEQARKLGFLIIQLLLSKELMGIRNRHRIEHEGYDDVSMYFKYMIAYQEELMHKRVIDKAIDANQPVEIIARELLEAINTV